MISPVPLPSAFTLYTGSAVTFSSGEKQYVRPSSKGFITQSTCGRNYLILVEEKKNLLEDFDDAQIVSRI
jgi:hypothetical protein